MRRVYHVHHPLHQLPLFGSSKICCSCQIEKPLDEFYKRSPSRGGYQPWCKDCNNAKRRLKRIQNIENPPERKPLTSQVCKQCQIEKPITAFYVDPLNARGYRATCKDCIDMGDTRTKNRGRRRKVWNLPVTPGYKRCWICENEKLLSEFILIKGEHHSYCNECRCGQRREQWSEIKEDVLTRNREKWPTISQEERERRNAYNRKNSKTPRAKLKNAEKRRRRASAYGSAKVDYPSILERDGSWCYICERDIDITLSRPHPARLTFDHVIPINPHPGNPQGIHEASNIKPCHYVCNCRKQNRQFEDLTPHQRRGPDL